MIRINQHIFIDPDELREKFIRSSGPGGQNVNKVATAVQLRFDAKNSPSLPEDVRARLVRLAGRRITEQGEIVIEASRFRNLVQNRQDALKRLVDLIRRAALRPKPRRKTKPTAASRKRRLESKRQRSHTKNLRHKIGPSED